MILDRIMAKKRPLLRAKKEAYPLSELKAQLADAPPVADVRRALAAAGVSLIAEVKRASPSRGLLCPDFDPVHLARTYAENGAAAISVLTDAPFFQGDLAYLRSIRAELKDCPPLLRKDFLFDPYQIVEARAYGADAVLLIVAILDDVLLKGLLTLSETLGLAALVEVHIGAELSRALEAGANLIGINNRDLHDFSVDLATTERLRSHIPADVIVVSESGVHGPDDVRRLARSRVDAVLVGEALVTAADTAHQVRTLAQAGREVQIAPKVGEEA